MSFSGSLDPDYLVRVAGNTLLLHLDPSSSDDLAYAHELFSLLISVLASKEFDTKDHNKNVFPNTALHRRKFRLLQSCLILFGCITSCQASEQQDSHHDWPRYHEMLWRNVAQETLPSTRSVLEWMLCLGYVRGRFPVEELQKRLSEYHGNAAMSISVLTISCLVGMRSEEFRQGFFKRALPYFIHNNHAVRMFIVFIWERLYGLAQHAGRGSGGGDIDWYSNLQSFIQSSEHCQKFIARLKSDEHMLNRFDVEADLNCQFVFGEFPRRVGMAVDELVAYPSFASVDDSPSPLFPLVSTGRDHCGADCREAAVGNGDSTNDNYDGSSGSDKDEQVQQQAPTRFQQKMVPIELAAAEVELQGARRAEALLEKTRSGRIVVLGSYIDKVPNMAGLARTCEVLGAATLCLPNLSIVQSNDFQAVCMTADKWLDIQQVRPEHVIEYVEEKRASGYRIAAVEQSSDSIPLPKYRFAGDTVLVLGNERSGVPAEVLHLVDDCIEIPQFGLVRSLNVHVTGSIVLWEARKQLSNL